MHRVFVGFGSNIGDRLAFLQMGMRELEHTQGIAIASVSPVYETEPVGKKDQPRFLNAVAELQCSLTAQQVYERLKEIEALVGRMPRERWGPREIDLDLLYFGDEVIAGPQFIVPHRESSNRRFVLVPLSDIAADFVDPAKQCSIRALLEHCPDMCEVVRSPYQLIPSVREA